MITREPTPIEKRVAATQMLLDDWKDRPFDWKAGNHCGRMVADHLRRMGYTPPLAKAGQVKTELGALRALRRLGVETLGDALDKMGFVAIPPAAALAGDVIEMPSEGRLGALTVALGNGRIIGWHPDVAGASVLQPQAYVGAWRVDPKS